MSEVVKLSMYAVAARFNLEYPMNYELLRENLQRLDSVSFVSLAECVSDISKKIINLTFLKSKELGFTFRLLSCFRVLHSTFLYSKKVSANWENSQCYMFFH